MKKTLLSDILAGLTVSFAALSLGAAFGVMSGRGAMSGMIGAAVIPIVASLFGGTRVQASGPTAPMTAITAVVVAFAHETFAESSTNAEQLITLTILMSAVFIILAGIFRLGKFIKMVPQVIVLGFMNGIAVLIWVDQIKKLFGLGGKEPIHGDMTTNVLIAFSSLALIYLIPFTLKKMGVSGNIRRFLPSILITIIAYTMFTSMTDIDIGRVELGGDFKSFGDFTKLISDYFPTSPDLYSTETLLAILPFALQLCLLAYLDSLLTSLVVDKMSKETTNPNKELIAQGLANGVSGFLQGIPGAQATIRSVLLLNEGAKTRLAGVLVGVFALLGFVVFSNLITLIASAVFVGILLKAGLDVLDRDFAAAYMKNKWYGNKMRNFQAGFIVYTTVITVVIDLNVAVISGTILFYIAKRFFGMVDAEEEFEEVHGNELLGMHTEPREEE
ncbi:MAG: SulP family sulfate permease [Crocinitomicaceae bacterium]|jgi:SulP family sulfate permease